MTDHRAMLANIRTFPALIAFLRDEMGWPIGTHDFEEMTFDYSAEELGIDAANAAKIVEIRRLRPLTTAQPWGIFFVKFEPKRLPVVALRRILGRVALKKRASANSAERAAWAADDLLFVSNYGAGDERRISLAHFSQPEGKDDLATLKVLGWDNRDTPLHLDDVVDKLTRCLAWPENEKDLAEWRRGWRSAFTLRHREVINTSRELSVRLAALARALRDRIRTALAVESESGPLTKLMKAFQESLVHDLDADGFADMYAQTIAYGLLTARIANPKGVTADDLHEQMPVTNPFLKELMETFLHAGGRRGQNREQDIDFDELGVSEVVELLDDANMEAVVRDFGDRNPQEDPVIHFYELFLKEYDPKKRMQRGVFYTPRPVVSYIVRSVDELLRTEFGLEDGLADTTTWGEMVARHKDIAMPEGVAPDQAFVQILDPATGTGTFLVEVIDIIHKTLVAKWKGKGHSEKEISTLWNDYVPARLLPRLHGYELLMAPYAIAHLKIGLKLFSTGYSFGSAERARVYLTNALEPPSDEQYTLDFLPALAHEAAAVNEIKRKQRFTVVIGNPPYSVNSLNMNPWIENEIRANYYPTGSHREANPKLLLDDYVKFIRYGQVCIAGAQKGILGFITNHAYLDNLTFRRMRWSLLNTFSELRLLDLHGNKRKKETCEDGSADDNVFDIQQGTCIGLFVKSKANGVAHAIELAHLMGPRKQKYALLTERSATGLEWTSLMPPPPDFFFITQDLELFAEYKKYWKIDDILCVKAMGVKTNRDHLLIDYDKEGLIKRVSNLANHELSDNQIRESFGLADGRYWDTAREREKIRNTSWEDNIVRYLYRPFDLRWLLYQQDLIEIGRGGAGVKVMTHFLAGENLGLLFMRQVAMQDDYSHFGVTRFPVDNRGFYSNKGAMNVAPLFSFLDASDGSATSTPDSLQLGRCSNISKAFIRAAEHRLRLAFKDQEERRDSETNFGSLNIFHYMYAIFHSGAYRNRYSGLLKRDYPRLPLPPNREVFRALEYKGADLVAFHLLEGDYPFASWNRTAARNPLASTNHKFHHLGAMSVAEGYPKHEGSSVYFSSSAWFDDIPSAVWNFRIGGYQVCHKWLKDRKGRTLDDEDIAHYQKIIVALSETIRLMNEIDEVIEAHGGWPGAFQTANEDAAASVVAARTEAPFERVEPDENETFTTSVPLVTLKAAAGGFSASQEVDAESWVKPNITCKLRPGMFVAQVVGKSMEPLIPDGAYCLFRAPVTGTRQGKIVLVQHNSIEDPETGGRYTVKRYSSDKTADESGTWRHAAIRLMPENPDFEPIIIKTGDNEDLQVLAELIEVLD